MHPRSVLSCFGEGSLRALFAGARLLVEALVMTGADLSPAAKSWETQYTTAQDIYAEFYDQVNTS